MSTQTVASIRNAAIDHFRRGQLAQAGECLHRVLEANRADWEAWNMLGTVYGLLGDYSACENCCRQVISIQPGAFLTWNNLGNALKQQQRLDEAESAYREALRLQPDYAEANSNLGGMLMEKGRIQEAEPMLRKAIAVKPDHAGAYNNLGTLLLNRGELQEALVCCKKSLHLNPAQAESFYNLASVYMALGRLREAVDSYRQFLVLQPSHQGARIFLGKALEQLGLYEEALESVRQAIALDAVNADAHFTLGYVYQAMGKRGEAEQAYKQTLEIEPNHAGAGYFRAMLNGIAPEKAPKDYVRDLFDNYAYKFDNDLVNNLGYRTPDHLNRLFRERIAIPAGRKLRILDLGCGTGLMGPLLSDVADVLVGVDLSPKMVDKARERNIYSELIVGDVVDPLNAGGAEYDLVVAADVFVYIGDLKEVFESTRQALAGDDSSFLFSTEAGDVGEDYTLRESGRYAHSMAYIEKLSSEYGFEIVQSESVVLRKEGADKINGYLFLLRVV